MMLWLTVACASTSLLGQILTPGWITAPSPITVRSPTTAPSKMTDARLEAALPADHCAVQLAPFTDVAVAHDDAAIDAHPVVEDGVVAYHRRPVDHHPALDLDFLSQVDRAKQLRVRRNLDRSPRPDAATDVLAQLAEVHDPVEQVSIRPLVLRQRAGVAPVTFRQRAIERLALGEHGRKNVVAPIKVLPGRDAAQDLGFHDVDPGVDRIRSHLTPARLLQELGDAPILAHVDDAELERIGHVIQGDRDHGLAFAMVLENGRQVKIGERIAADDQERFIVRQIGPRRS